MEQSAVDECFRGGGWAKRMRMCSEEQRGFERCFLMQTVCSISSSHPSLSVVLCVVVFMGRGGFQGQTKGNHRKQLDMYLLNIQGPHFDVFHRDS